MKPIPLSPIFFEAGSGSYFLELNGRFISLDKSEVKLHLRQSGLSDNEYVGNLNQLERAFWLAQTERCVDYAGPLSGHKAGLLKLSDDTNVLVTCSPRVITPERGKWDTLRDFWESLLGDQVELFYAWIKAARESLLAGDFRPGQLFAMAGESGCGKSLNQQLITLLLGGRVGKPFRYMIGETPFNGELGGCEHWCIEDESASTDIRARRKFGASLKEACVNIEISIHPKGKPAKTLPTFRRVSASLNDEEENLCILPPMDSSIADKVILVLCKPAKVGSNRKKVWKQLTSELPAFCFWLERFNIPRDMQSPRYGVKAWQNEALLELLTSVSHEARLLSLIDAVIYGDGSDAPTGEMTSEQLENRILASSFRWQVEKLLSWPAACGVFLSRLEKKHPERIASRRVNGQRLWRISAAKR